MSGKLAASVMTVAKDQLRYWEILEKSVVTVNWFGCFCFFSMCISILLPLEGRLPFPLYTKSVKTPFCVLARRCCFCAFFPFILTHTHILVPIFLKKWKTGEAQRSQDTDEYPAVLKQNIPQTNKKNENQNQTKQRYKADKISWRSNQASSIVGAMTSQRFQFHLKIYLGAWVSISQALKWASFYFH